MDGGTPSPAEGGGDGEVFCRPSVGGRQKDLLPTSRGNAVYLNICRYDLTEGNSEVLLVGRDASVHLAAVSPRETGFAWTNCSAIPISPALSKRERKGSP